MDNVSSIEIKYNLIRKPNKKTYNIFEYAANFKILINDQDYLVIEDFAILDFAISLYKWKYQQKRDFLFEPSDYNAVILEFIEGNDGYSIFSIWSKSQQKYFVNQNLITKCIDDFMNTFIKEYELQRGSFYKEVKKWL